MVSFIFFVGKSPNLQGFLKVYRGFSMITLFCVLIAIFLKMGSLIGLGRKSIIPELMHFMRFSSLTVKPIVQVFDHFLVNKIVIQYQYGQIVNGRGALASAIFLIFRT